MTTQWGKIQEELRNKLVIPEGNELMDILSVCPYVIGLDISYIKGNDNVAVCTAVLLDFHNLATLLDSETKEVQIPNVPYQAGYLAFRELDNYVLVFQNLMARHLDLCDQIGFIMLDGNGVLHPNGLGLASHFGIISGFRTIGCGKKLHQFDGLDRKKIRAMMDSQDVNVYQLRGDSGKCYGWAVRKVGVKNPVYISPGHLVSHVDARTGAVALMQFRIPEPIRQADRLSREYIQTHREG